MLAVGRRSGLKEPEKACRDHRNRRERQQSAIRKQEESGMKTHSSLHLVKVFETGGHAGFGSEDDLPPLKLDGQLAVFVLLPEAEHVLLRVPERVGSVGKLGLLVGNGLAVGHAVDVADDGRVRDLALGRRRRVLGSGSVRSPGRLGERASPGRVLHP